MESTLVLVALAWLATYLLHSTLFLGGAWILERHLTRERSREVLWKSALLAGVLTSGLQAGLGLDPFGGRIPIAPQPLADVGAFPATDALLGDESLSFGDAEFLLATQPPLGAASPSADLAVAFETPEDEVDHAGLAALITSDFWRANALRFSLLFWVGGVALLTCVWLLARQRLAFTLAGAQRVQQGPLPGLLALLRRRAGLKRQVALYTAPHLGTPIATGVLFPKIYVPPRALTELDRPLQEAMLAHELGHVSRLDPLWLGLGRGIATLFFLQPLNRIALRRLARTSEFLCDAWAVEQTRAPLALARCLSEVAHWLHGTSSAAYACGMAGLRSPLGERVERLVDGELERGTHRWGFAPLGAAVLATGAFLVPGFAAPDRALDAPTEAAVDSPFGGRIRVSTEPDDEGPLGGFALDLTQVRAELLGLELELLKLRRDGVSPDRELQLVRIEVRLRELLARRDRIENLLERANALLSETIPLESTPHAGVNR